jgi:hypothetical protein
MLKKRRLLRHIHCRRPVAYVRPATTVITGSGLHGFICRRPSFAFIQPRLSSRPEIQNPHSSNCVGAIWHWSVLNLLTRSKRTFKEKTWPWTMDCRTASACNVQLYYFHNDECGQVSVERGHSISVMSCRECQDATKRHLGRARRRRTSNR